MFVRQLAARRALSACASRRAWSTPKRQMSGGHGHDHHHGPEVMPIDNQLPAGDWRNTPVHFNFNKRPEELEPYESFVLKHVKGPESPYMRLTKGQFIVHMRSLWRQERKLQGMLQGAAFTCVAGLVVQMNLAAWVPEDQSLTRAEKEFLHLFEASPIAPYGARNPNPQVQLRLDTFFAEHPQETIDKLPADIQKVYNEYKDRRQ